MLGVIVLGQVLLIGDPKGAHSEFGAHFVLQEVGGQDHFVHNRCLVEPKLDEEDLRDVRLFLEDELFVADAPVGAGLVEGSLVYQLALSVPHLHQVLHVVVVLDDFLVHNLE